MSGLRTWYLILALLAVDAFVKAALPSDEPWMQHHRTTEWKLSAFFLLFIPVYICVRMPALRFVAALLIAGTVGNLLSAAVVGYVPDPLLWEHGDTLTSFNFADITLLMAIPALLLALVEAWKKHLRRSGIPE